MEIPGEPVIIHDGKMDHEHAKDKKKREEPPESFHSVTVASFLV